MLALTEEEQAWLEQTKSVTIGYLSSYMPYCGTNAATGQLDGVLADLLKSMEQAYPLPYEAVPFDCYEDMRQALYDGQVDAIFPVFGDYSIAEAADAMVSDAVTTSTMIVFNNKSTYQLVSTLALTHSDPFQDKYAALYYPDAQVLVYDTVEDCIDAVINGAADFTIAESANLNESTITRKSGIQEADLQKPINISFAVRRGQIRLLSVLNKGIAYTDDTYITNSLIHHSQQDVEYGTLEFLQDHIISVLVFVLGISGMIIGSLVAYFTLRTRSQKQLWEAEQQSLAVRWQAEHDALTGLLNRAAFQNTCAVLAQSKKPLALLVIDVDRFKDINDTYGHHTGDRALIKVSRLLTEHFRADDIIVRYAGDEFVVILTGMMPEKFHSVAEKITLINQLLKTPLDDIPPLSISVGVAFSPHGYRDDLFFQADQALYRAKEHGRGIYSM
jgi:diguanylate cyclase (GGDEF)-like protein